MNRFTALQFNPLCALPAALLLLAGAAPAQVTDIASAPLAQSVTDNVKPNLMFVLDDSGSMGSRYLPDYINDNNIDKPRCADRNGDPCGRTVTIGLEGNPPWYAYQFNSIYYNPNITYQPPLNADGSAMTSYGSPWSNVRTNGFSSSSTTINLVGGYPEVVYCLNWNDDPNNATTFASNCRQHGAAGTGQTGNPFTYNTATVTNASLATGLPNGTATGNFRFARTRNVTPYYFIIQPTEHCSDETLTNCTASAVKTASFPFPAPIRYCNAASDANSTTAVSGTVVVGGRTINRCQDKWTPDQTRPRYGRFERVDIVSTTPTYGGRPDRSDCASRPTCTYTEEMTNFANWYAYYSDRLRMMKSAAGRAFASVDNRFRVGLITINPGNPVSTSKYLKIDTFENVPGNNHRSNWYSRLYGATSGSTTPLRVALSRVGRHFAGKTDGINDGMDHDPVQYSCQRNVALLTTDGYWNEGGGVRVDGSTAIGNQDNVDSGVSARTLGVFDGNLGASGFTSNDTLADVAQYYFRTDLRPDGSKNAAGIDVSEANVPTSDRYTNPEQHMVTFTLGLGLDGRMRYQKDYETATSGDFWKIKNGQNTCPWGAAGACNWPQIPTNPAVSDTNNVDPSKIDDLWHAAVNGRGSYISARDADSLVNGLIGALNEMKTRGGAAAASATSSPNITQTDNFVFRSTYRTAKWDGELEARKIDPVNGSILPKEDFSWSARDKLNALTGAAVDERTIYTNAGGGSLVPFLYGSLDSTAKGFFDNRCALLSQCTQMTAGERTLANSGINLVNFLRGQREHEGALFRARDYVLGDMAGSRPAFVREPRRKYGDAVAQPYASFKTNQANRAPVVYIGSNSGMLHAFNANDGRELWAFVPRAMLPNLYRLADQNYGALHRYYVDGSPTVQDVFFGGAWRTVLVSGYNAGGRGFFALDVTNPAAPTLLWEICADSALCSNVEADMGLSFGNPVVTKRAVDGRWVALLTSGYNNVSPGNGAGWLYVVDIQNGTVLNRVSTGVGSNTSPSGLARISAWVRDPATDNTALYAYGGDLEGNVWRFDLSTSPPAVLRLATLRDASNRPQPLTARPELGQIKTAGGMHRAIFVATGRLLGVSDLQDPATLTPAGTWSYRSTIYAIKDSGTALGNPRGSMVQQTISGIDAASRTVTRNPVDWDARNGWFVDLPVSGERVNIDPQLALGTLLVTSNIPNNNACTAGGSSWLCALDYRTGGFVTTASGQVACRFRSSTLTVGNVIFQLANGEDGGGGGGDNGGAIGVISTGADGEQRNYDLPVDSSTEPIRRIGWRELQR